MSTSSGAVKQYQQKNISHNTEKNVHCQPFHKSELVLPGRPRGHRSPAPRAVGPHRGQQAARARQRLQRQRHLAAGGRAARGGRRRRRLRARRQRPRRREAGQARRERQTGQPPTRD